MLNNLKNRIMIKKIGIKRVGLLYELTILNTETNVQSCIYARKKYYFKELNYD